MQFIVLGAGAIGCYVGGRLAAGGHTVCLVGRARVLAALQSGGLRVSDHEGFDTQIAPAQLLMAETLKGALEALAATSRGPAGRFTVLVCVKATATQEVARDIALACPAGTTVVSLQNGIDNAQKLLAQAPRMNVLAGMVPYNVVWRGDTDATAGGGANHHVHRTNAGVLQVQRDATSEGFVDAFRNAGLPMALSEDIVAIQWGKLLINLGNPVNALANVPLRVLILQRDYRVVLAALQEEALIVLKAAGLHPAKVGQASPRMLPTI